MSRPSTATFFTLFTVASFACNAPLEEPGGHAREAVTVAAADSLHDVSLDRFLRERATSFTITPELNHDDKRVRMVKEVHLSDFSMKMSFRIDPKQEGVQELFETWEGSKDVSVTWGPVFAKVEGLEAREVRVRLEDVQNVLLDPTVRTICGRYRVVGPMQMQIDGQTFDGTMKLSLTNAVYTTLGDPVDSSAADIACEEETWFFVFDYCESKCKFILPADPRVEGTCTLGGVLGMVTASGTPIGAAGAGQMGVLATTTAQCWNEFEGACKLVPAFFGDYCTCSSSNAPKLKCNPRPVSYTHLTLPTICSV